VTVAGGAVLVELDDVVVGREVLKGAVMHVGAADGTGIMPEMLPLPMMLEAEDSEPDPEAEATEPELEVSFLALFTGVLLQ